MNQTIITLTALVKRIVKDNNGSVEFCESVPIVGQHGDKAATKHLYINKGRLYAHVYNAWMENVAADMEHGLLSEQTLCQLIREIAKNK